MKLGFKLFMKQCSIIDLFECLGKIRVFTICYCGVIFGVLVYFWMVES